APVNLQAGNNFSTKLGSDGTTINYTVITTLGAQGSTTGTDLQGINGDLSGDYALGANIDASATSTWNSGFGFATLGNPGSQFAGDFDGLGHTISNLTINQAATDVGLFGAVAVGATVRNVGLLSGNITGGSYSGGLVGNNYGTV